MKVAVGSKSDVGRLRQVNEDSFLVSEPLFVVADGMGGHIAGDVASSTAIDRIRERSASASADPQTLAQLVRDANSAIWEKSQSDPSLRGMGTTCTLMFLDRAKATIAHVGDSRAYLFRDGQLEQLTEDHTLVERMVREGKIHRDEAEHHPWRSAITRALGLDPDVSVDLFDVDLEVGDRILLCSDGLSSMIDGAAIQNVLDSEGEPQKVADRLIDRANDAGGEDNITVLVIDMVEEGAATGAAATGVAQAHTQDRQATEPGSVAVAEAPPAPAADAEARRKESPSAVHVVRRRRGKLRWVITIVLTLAVLAGGYVGARWMLGNSYYVGPNEAGELTIFRGVPERAFGLSFRDPVEVSSTTIEDLPEFKRSDVKNGIKQEDLDSARSTLNNLERLASDFQQTQKEPKDNRAQDGNNNPKNGDGKRRNN